MPLCAKCGQENPAVARFCLACGSALAPAPAVDEERKLVSVLFADLVGFTSRAEQLDPEQVYAVLGPYHTKLRSELERCGGTVEKFIGDAVMALFGAPTAHEDDAERAVRAALAIRTAIADLNAADAWLDLHFRIGVTTGEVLIVPGARLAEGEHMASGDIVNTAARLQSVAPVDGVLVDERTYWATADVFEYRELEPVSVKGKAEPVAVWEAVDELERPVQHVAGERAFVGRRAELAGLEGLWLQVCESRRPGLATVIGSPGVGKTRLLGEFAARVGADVYSGRCLSYGEGITYWPVIEIVRAAAGIVRSDDSEAASRRLGELLERLAADDPAELRTMAAALANLIGETRTPLGTYSAAEIGQAELHWGIRRTLELLAQQSPLMLVFNDLHWAEPTLLELVRFVIDGAEAPLLLLATGRPELAGAAPPLLGTGELRLTIELDTLDESESRDLLTELLEDAPALSGALADRLLRNAGGNPLFLEETVRMLAEAGPPADGLDPDSLPVATTLQALIGARVDLLPRPEKLVTQHASVGGHVFWSGAVAYAAETDDDPDPRLEALKERDIVRAHAQSAIAGEREWAFKHILIRDVAYGQLPKARRSRLHKRFAEWVAALPGGDDELVEIVAYHLEQACRIAADVGPVAEAPPLVEAIEALRRAGEKAESREGYREADRYYARALELAQDGPPDARGELRFRRGGTLAALGALREAAAELEAAVEEARALDAPDLRCRALCALGNVERKRGRATAARQHLDEAAGLAAEIGDPRVRIRVAFEQAALRAWADGAIEDALPDLRAALSLAGEVGDRVLSIEGHQRLGTLLFNEGALGEAEEQFRRCAALAGELGSLRDEARATYSLGVVRFYLGDHGEAERLALQAHEWLERTGDNYFQLQNLISLAIQALGRGEPATAEARLREALALALEGGGWIVIEIYRLQIEALLLQGLLDDARELLAFAARNLPEEDQYARAALLLAEASVATAAIEPTAAATAFSEALRLLESQQLPIHLAEARAALAHALRRFGDIAGARAEFERARAAFARLGARALVAEIDEHLSALAREAADAAPLASEPLG